MPTFRPETVHPPPPAPRPVGGQGSKEQGRPTPVLDPNFSSVSLYTCPAVSTGKVPILDWLARIYPVETLRAIHEVYA